jgi:hypothetical protein
MLAVTLKLFSISKEKSLNTKIKTETNQPTNQSPNQPTNQLPNQHANKIKQNKNPQTNHH